MRAHSGGRLGLGLTALVFSLILLPSLTGRSLLAYRDMLQNYWPMKAAYWTRPGDLLLKWNPDLFGGMSYLADPVQQPFYLPNLAFRLFGVPAATGIPWYLLLHGLLALAGVFLLARRIVGGPAAACAAATFLLSGFLVSTLSTGLNFYCAYSWAPLVLWSVLRLAREPSWRNWALVALLTPMPLYAGDPQAFLQLVVVAGAIFLLAARPSPRQALLVGGSLLIGVAFLVAAPVRASLEVLFDLLRQSQIEHTGRGIWSFHPARLAELYVPELFGPLFRPGFWGQFTVNGPWSENYIHSAYVGALLPALLYMAIRHRGRLGLPILAGLLFFAWLALGAHSFGYDLLVRWIPGWENFRYPERLMLLPTLAAALLAGIGAEVLWARPRREQTRVILGSLAAGLLTLLACVRLAPHSPMADAASRIAVGASLIQLVAVGGAALLWTRMPPSRFGPLLFLGLLLGDLTVANRQVGQLPKKPFAAEPRVCAAIEEAARETPSGVHGRWRVHVDEEAMKTVRRVVPGRIGRALPSWGQWRWLEYQWGKRNLLNLCGLPYSVGLTSFAPLSAARIWNQAGPLRALRANSTRFVLTDSRSRLKEASDARPLRRASVKGLRLLELQEALPRLYRPAAVEALARQAFLDRLPVDARLLTARLAVLERARPPRTHPPASRGVVLAFQDDGDSLHFEIEQDEPGYWVLTDTFDPHWRAWIDGEPARLERANVRHRALWIPAGSHRVRMAYQPRMILALAAGAALGALALAALALRPASASGGIGMPRPGKTRLASHAHGQAAIPMNAALLPEKAPADVRAIGLGLREGNHQAFLVGGCVRDFLSKRVPRDWDIVTSAPPAFLKRRFHRALQLGSHPRAATFLVSAIPGSPPRQVSLLRGESIEEDLLRRDFTVNAMAVAFPTGTPEGLIDPYGGRRDLGAGVLRAVEDPEARFAEDPLRPLRAVRFEVELDLTPETATLAAMRRAGPAVARAAPERVRDELLRTLAGRAPSRGIERMRETGMLAALLPEIAAMVDVTQNRFHRLDVYRHTLAALDFVSESAEADPFLRLAVLLHDVGKPLTRHPRRGEPTFIGHERVGACLAEARAQALRLPKEAVERVRDLVRHHLIYYTDRWSDRAVRRFLRRVGLPRVPDLLRLYAADLRAKDPESDTGAAVPGEVAALAGRIEVVRSAGAALGVDDLAISGNDVMDALGIPPGPEVGQALGALLDRVTADPSLNRRERLLALLRGLEDPGEC